MGSRHLINRRHVWQAGLMAASAMGLAGCATQRLNEPPLPADEGPDDARWAEWRAIYGDLADGDFDVPAVDFAEVDPDVLRRIVRAPGAEPSGTIIVDTRERALFLILEGGEAVRYGVGVGREGLAWGGRAVVGRKAMWPRWTPTAAMIRREPEKNAPWAGGMEGGLENPLGARALYLYRDNKDLMYRIHGTNDPSSIGQAMSSGCIRMINQDVIDLFERVPLGAPVLVKR